MRSIEEKLFRLTDHARREEADRAKARIANAHAAYDQELSEMYRDVSLDTPGQAGNFVWRMHGLEHPPNDGEWCTVFNYDMQRDTHVCRTRFGLLSSRSDSYAGNRVDRAMGLRGFAALPYDQRGAGLVTFVHGYKPDDWTHFQITRVLERYCFAQFCPPNLDLLAAQYTVLDRAKFVEQWLSEHP